MTNRFCTLSYPRLKGLAAAAIGRAAIAIQRLQCCKDMLTKFGPDGTKAILDFVTRTEVLMAGHGGKAAVQLTIGVKIGDKLSSRPRFHVLNAEKLTKSLAEI